MTKRICLIFAMALGMLLGAAPSRSLAQEIEITGPLADASAVRHMRVYRKGRVQLQPWAGFTLQDEFSRTVALGGTLTYHVTDWLGFGVWGFGGVAHIDTALTDEVANNGQTTDRNRLSLPSRANFRDQIATMDWAVAAQAVFIPLRGKLSLFQKLFIDADFYISGGFALVGVTERADFNGLGTCFASENGATDIAACNVSQGARQSRLAPAPTFGVGLSLHVNDWSALNLEWRGLPFAWNTSGTDEYGVEANGTNNFPDQQISSDDRRFIFNHMFVLGWTFYLPTHAPISD